MSAFLTSGALVSPGALTLLDSVGPLGDAWGRGEGESAPQRDKKEEVSSSVTAKGDSPTPRRPTVCRRNRVGRVDVEAGVSCRWRPVVSGSLPYYYYFVVVVEPVGGKWFTSETVREMGLVSCWWSGTSRTLWGSKSLSLSEQVLGYRSSPVLVRNLDGRGFGQVRRSFGGTISTLLFLVPGGNEGTEVSNLTPQDSRGGVDVQSDVRDVLRPRVGGRCSEPQDRPSRWSKVFDADFVLSLTRIKVNLPLGAQGVRVVLVLLRQNNQITICTRSESTPPLPPSPARSSPLGPY